MLIWYIQTKCILAAGLKQETVLVLNSWAALLKTSPDLKCSHSTAEQLSRSRKPLDRWSISEGSEGTHNRHNRHDRHNTEAVTCNNTKDFYFNKSRRSLTIKLSACMKTCFLVSHITATITLYVLWHGSLKQPYYHHYTTHNVSCSMFSRV